MSRAYRIRISETITKTVHVEDGLAFHLEILDVLPKQRMAQLLAEHLTTRGFEEQPDGRVAKDMDGVHVQVDPQTGQVTVGVSVEEQVSKSTDSVVRTESPERAVKRARQLLERRIDADKQAHQQAATQHLEQHVGDIRTDLDRVSTAVVAQALKERAAELGEVQEIVENAETGELTIRVRV